MPEVWSNVLFFDNGLPGSAEQGAAGTVVTNEVVAENDFGGPGQVFYAESFFGSDCWGDGLVEGEDEFFSAFRLFLLVRTNGGDFGWRSGQFHRGGTDKLYCIAGTSPFEAVGLAVHVASHNRFVVDAFHDFEVGAVDVDGVVHHVFVQSVAGDDFPFAAGEMGGIRLGSEVAGILIAFKAYAEAVKGDVFA